MAAYFLIVMSIMFPMSNAYAEEFKASYTTYTIDPQRKTISRCELGIIESNNAIICIELSSKELRKLGITIDFK